MRVPLLLCLCLTVAACAAQPPGVKPVAGGESKRDGIVTMESSGTIYNPVSPDWSVADAAADRRCRSWGYEGAASYAGSQETCRAWDRYGRCFANRVTRFYPCSGG